MSHDSRKPTAGKPHTTSSASSGVIPDRSSNRVGSAALDAQKMGTGRDYSTGGDAGSAVVNLVPRTGGAERPRVFLWEAAAAAVRVVGTADAPWFVAKDVCAVLEIVETHRAIAGLDEDEKGRHTVTTLGGPQEVSTVNESGLYALIFRSRKDQARVFRKWVTAEVLPQIRKTGAYAVPAAQPFGIIEIIHRPQPPAVVPDSEEHLVAQLLFSLLNHRERGVFHGATLVDIARRDEEFASWFPREVPTGIHKHSGITSGFLRRLVAYHNRPLTGCFSPDARVQIIPQGHGRDRRYVITSWRVQPMLQMTDRTSAGEASAIIARALSAGGEVIVK